MLYCHGIYYVSFFATAFKVMHPVRGKFIYAVYFFYSERRELKYLASFHGERPLLDDLVANIRADEPLFAVIIEHAPSDVFGNGKF